MDSNGIYNHSRADIIRFISTHHNIFRPESVKYINTIKNSTWGAHLAKRHRGEDGLLVFLERSLEIAQLYFGQGMGTESICQTLTIFNSRVKYERFRTYKDIFLRERTEEEQRICHQFHYRKAGMNNARPDLIAAHDEWLSMYKSGISSEEIGALFNCSPTHVLDVLKFHSVFYEFKHKVRIHTQAKLANIRSLFSPEKLASILEKRLTTRSKRSTDQIAQSRAKFIKTLCSNHNITDSCVTNPSQIPSIHNKQQKYRFYTYCLPSGSKIQIQGYERFALNQLLSSGVLEEEIHLRKSFWYENKKGSKSRYYADIVVGDTIIEVKSLYTLLRQFEKNWCIMKSMMESDHNFQIWCFNTKGERTHCLLSLQELAECARLVVSDKFRHPLPHMQ